LRHFYLYLKAVKDNLIIEKASKTASKSSTTTVCSFDRIIDNILKKVSNAARHNTIQIYLIPLIDTPAGTILTVFGGTAVSFGVNLGSAFRITQRKSLRNLSAQLYKISN